MCKCQLLPPPLPVTTKPLSQKAGRTSVGQNHKKRTSATLPLAHSHADVEVLLLAQHGLGELLLRAALRAHQLRGDRQRSHGVNSFAYSSPAAYPGIISAYNGSTKGEEGRGHRRRCGRGYARRGLSAGPAGPNGSQPDRKRARGPGTPGAPQTYQYGGAVELRQFIEGPQHRHPHRRLRGDLKMAALRDVTLWAVRGGAGVRSAGSAPVTAPVTSAVLGLRALRAYGGAKPGLRGGRLW